MNKNFNSAGNSSQNNKRPGGNRPAAAKKAPTQKEIFEQNAKIKAYRMEMAKYALKYVGIVAAAGLILALILFGFISCNFFTGLSDGGDENYSYSIELFKGDPKEDGEREILKHESIFIGGKVYIPLTSLKQYSEYTIAGDSDSISVIYGSTGGETFDVVDKAEFLIDSNCVRVNKNRVTLDAPIIRNKDELYIPYDFVKLYMSGFNIEESKKGQKITIRISRNGEPVGYRLMESSADYPPIETEYFPEALPNNVFSTDFSTYEEFMTPDNEKKYLVLANNSSRLPETYDPGELMDINYTLEGRGVQKLEKYAAMSLEAMLKEAAAAGLKSMYVVTGFRSYASQKAIYDPRYEENKEAHGAAKAEAETIKTVSYPGASDHQTGFGFNFEAPAGFETSPEYAWLISHCSDFGFILRYPKDKVDVTGVDYEAGHFRFVGRYHAQNIMREGLCLEEYLEKYASTIDAN